jgi:hypothetical protein
MANLANTFRLRATSRAAREQPAGSVRFDWTATALSGALVGGVYLDAWAHEHGRVDTTFFTPWHGMMYTAMLVVALFLLGNFRTNMLHGYMWRRALPTGYGLALLGTLVFALGGIGDMVWHMLFGVEASLEALLSPTHLVLALGWILIVSGPLRAAWHRSNTPAPHRLAAQFPVFFSLACTLSVLTFFTVYANPFTHTLAAINEQPVQEREVMQALGVVGFLVQPALLMGLVLLALRRWTLPRGALTLVITFNTTLMAILHDQYLLIAVAAGAGGVADILYDRLQPSLRRLVALRIFSFAVPFVLYTLYFLALLFTVGIWWSIHLWVGAIVLASVVGLLLSYLLVPPPLPELEHN